MQVGELAKLLKGTSMVVLGLVVGAAIAVTGAQYPGVIELELKKEGTFLKMDGQHKCDLVAQP